MVAINIVKHQLPWDGQRVRCFGHKTNNGAKGMEEVPEWHDAQFRLKITYIFKDTIPTDPEESILKDVKVIEWWEHDLMEEDKYGNEISYEVIGVTKWAPDESYKEAIESSIKLMANDLVDQQRAYNNR